MGESQPNGTRDAWHLRFQAVARAQARYLYLLVVVGLFYWALDGRIRQGPPFAPVSLPVVQVEIDPWVVWASASPVLAALLLGTLGTFRALSVAHDRVKGQSDDVRNFESLDTSPTLIDFVFYTKTASGGVARFSLVAYPLVLTIFFVEAMWLLARLWELEAPVPGLSVFLVIGSFELPFSFWGLAKLWFLKLKQAICGTGSVQSGDVGNTLVRRHG